MDYRERSQLWLHSQIGYVLQSLHMFSGTVRENIRFGRLDASDQEVEEAARQVSADAAAARLEHGYESNVGESGGRLSVGVWMGEGNLMTFGYVIQKAIRHVLRGHTSFIIAHRLSAIRQADLILVVKDGRSIKQESHEELLKQEGYYYDLYFRQFEEEAAMQVFKEG